jgi:adenylylsulfate kinase
MLIAMAGLPGAGKSTVAARLASALGAVVLNKDQVRAALFPPPVLNNSAEQDDLCMAVIYQAAAYILKASPRQHVIIDGRTFLRPAHLDGLFHWAASLNEAPRLIECVCDDEVARARLEQDQVRDSHPAKNRTYALYLAVKARAEPIPVPQLVLDTGKLSLDDCTERCLGYLQRGEAEQQPEGTS